MVHVTPPVFLAWEGPFREWESFHPFNSSILLLQLTVIDAISLSHLKSSSFLNVQSSVVEQFIFTSVFSLGGSPAKELIERFSKTRKPYSSTRRLQVEDIVSNHGFPDLRFFLGPDHDNHFTIH
jgi:hypothetical protein